MDIGALIFPTDKTIRPNRLGIALEESGYDSLWVAEHTHIPLTRKTPYPAGGELPDFYKRTMDPFVALSVAATMTSTLKLGTGICLVNQHHAINLAKQCASVDLVSDGRFLFGVGVGWNEDEMEHHGVDPSKRRSTARERILAVKELWSQEAAEFHGDYVDFSP
ncbi:MAG: TIGR03619 family F420-dependent LLM class oxidoreductase, partial [Actinomycetota bacterium]|nr:TIGR03619 family F420-dependent LLM class oxidoreductase [Actinomycetota bacterium]